jgi:hypothetical protein
VVQPEPGLEHNLTFLERPENSCEQHTPSNLTELETICREEWDKLHKYSCAKLTASYLRRLYAVIAAKGASTKY